MTFAEHAVAQVLREVAAELSTGCCPIETGTYGEVRMRSLTIIELAEVLNKIAQRLSPKPPGEK